MAAINRRRFLVVAGMAVAGAFGVGATWLTRSDSDVVGAPPSTSLPPSAAPATGAPTTGTPTTGTPTTTSTTAVPATTSSSTSTTTTTRAPASISVICKDAWRAEPVAGDFTAHTIEHITVHHTAVLLSNNTAAPGRVRQHQGFHQGLGWPDVAYHYIIDANGHIYEGRPVGAVGDTATDYDPTGHFLVCCEGDLNSQQITTAQYQALVNMLAWGVAEFGVEPAAIRGHRDVASTTCPGDNLYPLIADGTLADDVAALVAAGVPHLEVVCGSEGSELVVAIEAGDL